MTLPLEGKVALITGSSRGIGKATALQLARDGADIVVCARSLESSEEYPGSIGETAGAVRAFGRCALPVQADILEDADLRNAVEATMEEFGRIDILVNNAAIVTSGPILKGDVSLLERSFAANVRAPFVMTQLVAPLMVANGGGLIVNISSGAARHPPPPAEDRPDRPRIHPGPEYGISKAALDRLSTGIAEELGAHNIAVVSIWPGFTLTERMAKRQIPGLDMSTGEPMETTAKAVAFVCREPMRHNGRILQAREVVDQNGL
ncbi:MAG TPA: SDR family NAD(P)-dependent oxidoreductase [Dehalococcoidia bacterium]|nr:SDR family NAD(P)-dependent oxidoreductase [Dehalococcoidia bacterium]